MLKGEVEAEGSLLRGEWNFKPALISLVPQEVDSEPSMSVLGIYGGTCHRKIDALF